jgi:hypothetical protein
MFVDEIVNRGLSVATIWLTLVVAGVYLFIFEPGRSGFFPLCPFRALTGFTCPGCGTTRGLHQLLHGNLTAAFMLNPLMVLVTPFLLYALIRHTGSVMLGKPVKGNIVPAKYIYALFGFVLFFWIFRNTPFYPFPS